MRRAYETAGDFIDKSQLLANCGADDLRSFPIRNRLASRQHICFAEMSRLSKGDKGDRDGEMD